MALSRGIFWSVKTLVVFIVFLTMMGEALAQTSASKKKSKGFFLFRVKVEMNLGLPKKDKTTAQAKPKRRTKSAGKPSTSKVGHKIKELFTNKYKHCKINAVNSGIAVGQVIETQKYGMAVVQDFVIGKKKNHYFKFADRELIKRKEITRKVSAVKNIVVKVPRNDKPRTKSGEPNFKKITLSRSESKEIIMRQLIQRQKLNLLVQMYPEERENIDALKLKYGAQKTSR